MATLASLALSWRPAEGAVFWGGDAPCPKRLFCPPAKSQSSMEFLIVIGIAFLVIVPATYFFLNFSRESAEEITFYQFEAIGRDIVSTAESLFYSGESSKTVISLRMPKGIESAAIIDKRELVFNVSTSSGYTDFVFFSRVNLTPSASCGGSVCALEELSSAGVRNIKLTALDSSVQIEQGS